MNDPVTTITGITFNRESIEQWLIQSWHLQNSSISVEKIIPTSTIEKFVKNLDHESLEKLLALALENERNRTCMVEAGVAKAIIQKVIIDNFYKQDLCCCADGREQFVQHAAGIALISKRTLRVSSTTDDCALQIFCLISKYCATNDVVQEMLRVGAVSKLCMVMQADCGSYLKEKARGVLRLHSNVWNNSPCIQVYLLTRHQRFGE
ncbi:E3 ubiquitin-protein ligase PUB22 [Trifolium repens]|nr:E3 ubiquitin-protein ligase PUB22 [Trifolium repens]